MVEVAEAAPSSPGPASPAPTGNSSVHAGGVEQGGEEDSDEEVICLGSSSENLKDKKRLAVRVKC